MPSLETARRIASAKNSGAKTVGQIYKEHSDFLMEETWDNNIQSKVCYIYDYWHDDQPEQNIGMTYDNTIKTRIDAKFIVKSYQSIDKDQVEYYIQFKPSQKTSFTNEDELYYFETDYRNKYHNDDFIGLYCDIPDDKGIYRKWLICRREAGNQFVKYLVLPINYHFMWIETSGRKRIKRKMWCVLKNQNSYNSGLWSDYRFTSQENQDKVWLPLNSVTEKIWYTNDNSKNMRVLVGAFTENPIAWTISKIENANTLGIQMLTLYQDFFDQHRDYIEKDSNGNIIGMWADYWESDIEPVELNTSAPVLLNTYGKINTSTPAIKVGGSYRTLTLKLYDSDDNEITDNYSNAEFEWSCGITSGDETAVLTDKVTWLNGNSFNQKKIKFPDNRSYLNKILDIKCIVIKNTEIIETTAQLELII